MTKKCTLQFQLPPSLAKNWKVLAMDASFFQNILKLEICIRFMRRMLIIDFSFTGCDSALEKIVLKIEGIFNS